MNRNEQRRINMMKAALPYSFGASRQAMELLLQVNTLYHTAQMPLHLHCNFYCRCSGV